MTNQAITAVLDHLCNEARNFAHSNLGVMELLEELSDRENWRASARIGAASADELLRSIDDVRELLSGDAPAPSRLEEFDLAVCAGEIAEVLSLASIRWAKRFVIHAPSEPLVLTQQRKQIEEILTRVLHATLKLARPGDAVRLRASRLGDGYTLAVAPAEAATAERIAHWLNLHPDQSDLQELDDVPMGIPVMVAGKRLRGLAGAARMVRDSAETASVILHFPSEEQLDCDEEPFPQPDSLNILIAEDCDDSFFLTESMLPNERRWRAHDGRQALGLLQRQRFDVVLMDVHMPEMNGYQVIRQMREWETQTGNARTPMVILSSDDLETQRREAAQCGCSGFLRKPLRGADLAGLIDRLKQAKLLAA